jgi:hypothetical protein
VRDNHPKHRQRRRESRRLERKQSTRAGLPAILIVCEGRETEPNYLRGLCDEHGVNRANVIVIAGDEETNAIGLVRKARRRFELDRDFDAVFVVCDCAGEDLTEARRLAAVPLRSVTGELLPVSLIVSRPSFEFWLLLHFEYAARPFPTADSVIDLLRRHVTDYEKADRQIFGKVRAGLDRAIGHVGRLKAELAAIGALSPDTDMPVLLQKLMSLRRRRDR